jgi:pSer/pThr/pTyr-binding forkhead associated (FHA) protein
MADTQSNLQGVPLSVQGPSPADDCSLPPDFVPMRLVLESARASVDLSKPDVLVGRHSDADVRLPLPDVSRRHCRFLWIAGQWRIVDLNSLNGVFVNDEQVEQAPLHAGDKVRIGSFTFLVELPPPRGHTQEGRGQDALQRVLRFLPRSRRAS